MDRPEIVIGLVGAVGTDLGPVIHALTQALEEVRYGHSLIHLSKLLPAAQFPIRPTFVESPYEKRLDSYMDAGSLWRSVTKCGDAVALLGVAQLRRERQVATQDNDEIDLPIDSHAYVIVSLKNPAEVETLRNIYGPSFFLLSAYSPRQLRVSTVAQKIAESHSQFDPSQYMDKAQYLVNRDEEEKGDEFGQRVRETFWRGDAFVDASKLLDLPESVRRIVQLWFGHPFHTPTRDEYLMFSAQAAALRSASLGRQVGAVIATPRGSIVATGMNEVPTAGGGPYWTGDPDDRRDHVLGFDSSARMQRDLLGDIVGRLCEAGWLAEDKKAQQVPDLVQALLDDGAGVLRAASLTSLTEFQRPVHAEMMALTDAAMRGVAVAGCTLYTTTFPCHGCARHLVAAGVMRVVFIEPYAKSLARNLHEDSIRIEDSIGPENRVRFEAFVGLAPKRYLDFYSMKKRKYKDGTAVTWEPHTAKPNLSGWSHFAAVANEVIEMEKLNLKISEITRKLNGEPPQ